MVLEVSISALTKYPYNYISGMTTKSLSLREWVDDMMRSLDKGGLVLLEINSRP
jgi:hypothetical protein